MFPFYFMWSQPQSVWQVFYIEGRGSHSQGYVIDYIRPERVQYSNSLDQVLVNWRLPSEYTYLAWEGYPIESCFYIVTDKLVNSLADRPGDGW